VKLSASFTSCTCSFSVALEDLLPEKKKDFLLAPITRQAKHHVDIETEKYVLG